MYREGKGRENKREEKDDGRRGDGRDEGDDVTQGEGADERG
jgi:hypothetical protein